MERNFSFELILGVSLLLGQSIGAEVGANWRIQGGQTAAEGQFRYQVSIRNASRSHFCGGSIITNRWILTAAHCTEGKAVASIYVVVGTTSRTLGGTAYPVVKILQHESYRRTSTSVKNDIALLLLGKEIRYSQTVLNIELETQEVSQVEAVVSGWGVINVHGHKVDLLQYMVTKIYSAMECNSFIAPASIDESKICEWTNRAQGTCSGDSGGPVVVNRKQVGIVSYGLVLEHCNYRLPNIFTKVSHYSRWIHEKLSKNGF